MRAYTNEAIALLCILVLYLFVVYRIEIDV